MQIEGNPNWLGSLFYLPHAARVLCIVYFGWKAIPALFLAELWGPDFSILDIEKIGYDSKIKRQGIEKLIDKMLSSS